MHPASDLLVRLMAAACVTLAGCGGPAILKEPQPIEPSMPLAEAKDERVHVVIEAVILRNGPGAWVRDALWDEYVIRIRTLSDEPVEIREVAIFDAFDYRVDPRPGHIGLVNGTREIERRYRESGKVVSAVSFVTGCRAFADVGWALRGIVGLALAGPCVMDLVDDAAVSDEIKRRQTALPVALSRGGEASVDLFFPRTPQSERTQVVYADRQGEHRLDIDTRQALLELGPPTLVSRLDPEFPDHARREGIKRGWVKANLTVDRQGRVQSVEVIESWPRYFFDEEARRTFLGWTYNAGRGDGRTVEEILQFKR